METVQINKFLKNIEYNFNDLSLLEEAMTHPSVFGNAKKNKKNSPGSPLQYQRLEFLGDAILSFIITELLIIQFPKENEGLLSKRKAHLVSGEVISQVAFEIGLSQIIKVDNKESILDGRRNKKILENGLEALIGAMYLDSNLIEVKKFITRFWQKILRTSEPKTDPVSKLQEITQAIYKKLPDYEIEKIDGKDHLPMFLAKVKIGDIAKEAQGKSKKEAQREVATKFLKEEMKS